MLLTQNKGETKMKAKMRKGFTLVEILIVVVILGILAAIVIPQFSEASTESKVSSCLTTLQTLRSQIALYKIQHNDTPPALATFEAMMTTYSDSTGATYATKAAALLAANEAFGPYMQTVPLNAWNQSDTLEDADAANLGWVYDEVEGSIYIAVTDVANAEVVTKLTAQGAVAP
jgi:general secretion pathway protein G